MIKSQRTDKTYKTETNLSQMQSQIGKASHHINEYSDHQHNNNKNIKHVGKSIGIGEDSAFIKDDYEDYNNDMSTARNQRFDLNEHRIEELKTLKDGQ